MRSITFDMLSNVKNLGDAIVPMIMTKTRMVKVPYLLYNSAKLFFCFTATLAFFSLIVLFPLIDIAAGKQPPIA